VVFDVVIEEVVVCEGVECGECCCLVFEFFGGWLFDFDCFSECCCEELFVIGGEDVW